MENWQLLIDSNRGVYIPQQFAQYYDSNIKAADKAVLLAGPEHADYWEVWDNVEGYCRLELANEPFELYQSEHGDLWAVPVDFDWDTYNA